VAGFLSWAEPGGSMTFEAKTLAPLHGHPDAANGAFEDAVGVLRDTNLKPGLLR
jgi:hypothetical protein